MFDPQKLLEQFLGGKANPDGSKTGGMSPDFMKGLATGGMAGGLAGLLLGSKGGKKMVGVPRSLAAPRPSRRWPTRPTPPGRSRSRRRHSPQLQAR